MCNILEDEWIERLMEAKVAGVRGLLKELAAAAPKEAPPLDPTSDAPAEVLNHLLQGRWAPRAGVPIKGRLSARNEARWA